MTMYSSANARLPHNIIVAAIERSFKRFLAIISVRLEVNCWSTEDTFFSCTAENSIAFSTASKCDFLLLDMKC